MAQILPECTTVFIFVKNYFTCARDGSAGARRVVPTTRTATNFAAGVVTTRDFERSIDAAPSAHAAHDSLTTGARVFLPLEKNSDMFIATERQGGVMSTPTAGARTAVILGGTSGIGKEIVISLAGQGMTVYFSGRTTESAQKAAKEIGHNTVGIAVDLSEPETLADALAGIEALDYLVIPAIERDANTVADYNVARAIRLVTLKLVGYTEAIHVLRERFSPDGAIVLFGGLATQRPYPGSTTVSTVNGGVVGIVNSLATEIAPIRINAIHPGIVGDSPFWQDKDTSHVVARTPLGRLVSMREVVHATEFLLQNSGVNGVNLNVDGGWLLK
jgi:NAD(P)-dependent dehydrogenase (short-subunit alcohol dehydrogenase family)